MNVQREQIWLTLGFIIFAGTADVCVAQDVKRAMSIIDLQEWKEQTELNLPSQEQKSVRVRLINLNPKINSSFILELNSGRTVKSFNLVNVNPASQKLVLDQAFQRGISIQSEHRVDRCELWDYKGESNLVNLSKSDKPYQSLCNGQLYLLVPVSGRSSTKEVVADFLRRNIWEGDQITTIVKNTFFKDGFLQVPEESRLADASVPAVGPPRSGPEPAKINSQDRNILLKASALNLPLKDRSESSMLPIAEWFELRSSPGIYVSLMEPGRVSDDIMNKHQQIAGKLDAIERKALVISVAYDLSQYDVGMLLGTEHPSLNWSIRASPSVRPKGWIGPDGFEKRDPVVTPGMVPPHLTTKVVSTFTSGFKRYHSAFRWGKLAQVNRGSHYGFIENGVMHSRLHPGLATLTIDANGLVDMKTWSDADQSLVSELRHARQNGVPIVEWDETTRSGVPGALVANWGQGNWSGSDSKTMRALRAGVCIQESNGRRYLIYGYFTSVTPPAMARVFQSYGCRYAMHMDMNALEHTYLAVYERDGSGSQTFYLDSGMKVLDESGIGIHVPRFVGMPDNRDFFYIVPKPKK
jgi:hypothetical protein